MNSEVMFSSKSVEWETPQELFDALNKRFSFTIDVCAAYDNAKCKRYFTPHDDGLLQCWDGERCWMNPPYGREIGKWVWKAMREAAAGALVVGLLPVRTDTEWWQNCVMGVADVRFISGRLHFCNAKHPAPFPSAIAVWWGWDVLSGKPVKTYNIWK